MFDRTRLTSWTLVLLLFGIPVCAALALEHAGTAGQRAVSARKPSVTAQAVRSRGISGDTSPTGRPLGDCNRRAEKTSQ